MNEGLPCGKCGKSTLQVKTQKEGPLPPGITVNWCGRCGMVNTVNNPFTQEVDI